MKFYSKLAALSAVLFTFAASAAPHLVNRDYSTLTFAGTHADQEFVGTFEKWDADITFDADEPADTSATISIDTASARTGNDLYDGTLPTKDWFDASNYPSARFNLTSLQPVEGAVNKYVAIGNLTIKNYTRPVEVPVSLQQVDGTTIAQATFPINRLDYDIGVKSDATAEWVSDVINVTLRINAAPQRAKTPRG